MAGAILAGLASARLLRFFPKPSRGFFCESRRDSYRDWILQDSPGEL